MTREAFRDAAGFFLGMVQRVPEGAWDSSALGVWTMRDLVGHTARAITSLETYWATPARQVDLQSPVDYFLRVREGLANPEAVAERGREAGRSLGSSPDSAVQEIAQRVLAGLDQRPDGFLLTVPLGGMRLIDYLPTRTFELTVHSLDVGAALGVDADPPASAMEVTLHLLADLAARLGRGPALALAATGRHPLPPGFSLLA